MEVPKVVDARAEVTTGVMCYGLAIGRVMTARVVQSIGVAITSNVRAKRSRILLEVRIRDDLLRPLVAGPVAIAVEVETITDVYTAAVVCPLIDFGGSRLFHYLEVSTDSTNLIEITCLRWKELPWQLRIAGQECE